MKIDLNNRINRTNVTFCALKLSENVLRDRADLKTFLKSKNVKILENHESLDLHIKSDEKGSFKFKITSKNEGLKGVIQNLRSPWIARKTLHGLPRKIINQYLENFHPQKAIDFAIETEEARFIKGAKVLEKLLQQHKK